MGDSKATHKLVRQHAGVSAFHVPSALPSLLPAASRFGAWHLFWVIILVFLVVMAAFIVPLEVRLRRQRKSAAHRGSAPIPRDHA